VYQKHLEQTSLFSHILAKCSSVLHSQPSTTNKITISRHCFKTHCHSHFCIFNTFMTETKCWGHSQNDSNLSFINMGEFLWHFLQMYTPKSNKVIKSYNKNKICDCNKIKCLHEH
jgi:hypothetical protein